MLAWVRSRLRPVAVFVLAATVGGGVSSVGHGSDCHGAECGMPLFPHDPSSHIVRDGSAADASHPLHCVLCHLTRLLRPSTEQSQHLVTPTVDDFRFHAEVRDIVSLAHAAQPPLRSPPV